LGKIQQQVVTANSLSLATCKILQNLLTFGKDTTTITKLMLDLRKLKNCMEMTLSWYAYLYTFFQNLPGSVGGLVGLFLGLVSCNFVVEAIELALQTGGEVS